MTLYIITLPPPPNLSQQSENEDIQGTAAKKDQLEINVPKNAVSCDKLGDTNINDFETIDNQYVDCSVVIYQHMDLLKSFFFISFESTFLLLLGKTAMLC